MTNALLLIYYPKVKVIYTKLPTSTIFSQPSLSLTKISRKSNKYQRFGQQLLWRKERQQDLLNEGKTELW